MEVAQHIGDKNGTLHNAFRKRGFSERRDGHSDRRAGIESARSEQQTLDRMFDVLGGHDGRRGRITETAER